MAGEWHCVTRGRGRRNRPKIITRAYAYAIGDGPQPLELETLRRIDRYGAQSIYGRVLGVREVRDMELAARTVNTYLSLHAAKDWAAWQRSRPNDMAFLHRVIRLYQQELKAPNAR